MPADIARGKQIVYTIKVVGTNMDPKFGDALQKLHDDQSVVVFEVQNVELRDKPPSHDGY